MYAGQHTGHVSLGNSAKPTAGNVAAVHEYRRRAEPPHVGWRVRVGAQCVAESEQAQVTIGFAGVIDTEAEFAVPAHGEGAKLQRYGIELWVYQHICAY